MSGVPDRHGRFTLIYIKLIDALLWPRKLELAEDTAKVRYEFSSGDFRVGYKVEHSFRIEHQCVGFYEYLTDCALGDFIRSALFDHECRRICPFSRIGVFRKRCPVERRVRERRLGQYKNGKCNDAHPKADNRKKGARVSRLIHSYIIFWESIGCNPRDRAPFVLMIRPGSRVRLSDPYRVSTGFLGIRDDLFDSPPWLKQFSRLSSFKKNRPFGLIFLRMTLRGIEPRFQA